MAFKADGMPKIVRSFPRAAGKYDKYMDGETWAFLPSDELIKELPGGMKSLRCRMISRAGYLKCRSRTRVVDNVLYFQAVPMETKLPPDWQKEVDDNAERVARMNAGKAAKKATNAAKA